MRNTTVETTNSEWEWVEASDSRWITMCANMVWARFKDPGRKSTGL